MQLEIDDAELAKTLVPLLVMSADSEVFRGAIQEASRHMNTCMIYGLLRGKPGIYDDDGKALWARAEALLSAAPAATLVSGVPGMPPADDDV